MHQAATISESTKSRAGGPIVRASAVSKSFKMGDSVVQVLQDVNLSIATGEFIAIEGRSGSGKSTLLHIMGALDSPTKGGVFFEGHEYTRVSPENARRGVVGVLTGKWFVWIAIGLMVTPVFFLLGHLAMTAKKDIPPTETTAWSNIAIGNLAVGLLLLVPVAAAWLIRTIRAQKDDTVSARIRNREFGFVFQFYHLLPELNVVENTMLGQMVRFSVFNYFGQRRALRERAIEVLTQLGMAHRLTHRPNQLSGGERQRVAIARALMNKPRVLFADEPTGNLDAETGRQIMDLLEKLHRDENQTIVMVTHDRTLAREADRVLVLKAGKLSKAE
ncbi:ABC transporter ATP-binding protein [Humisphaera borealis]|uniref:ABC transporter ATP-binding protein n=1 Tax=Humisphaera borealis TaxID=2807512 RepID=A0A7M2WVQ2_9BACT|nr:ABC transporter ATP-binding protein [Humisphaera borealis]QOV89503.1 ABC transporter ATP-binding protein [Humisphaera borealis]